MMHTKPGLWIRLSIGVAVLSLATPVFGQFAYVANQFSNDVSGHTINATTGTLTPIPGSPFAAGVFPVSVAVDPAPGKFTYVANRFLMTFRDTPSTPLPAPLRPFQDRPSPPWQLRSLLWWIPRAGSPMWRMLTPPTFRDTPSTPSPACSFPSRDRPLPLEQLRPPWRWIPRAGSPMSRMLRFRRTFRDTPSTPPPAR